MSDTFYGVVVVDIDTVMARVEELPPRAAAWVDRQLEVQDEYYYYNDDESLNALVDEAAGLDADVLQDADLPSLLLTPDELRAQIRERIAARIPKYQGASGGREPQIMVGEDNLSAHPTWYTQYQDRADIADRASAADEHGRVLDENGEPLDGTWGWVMDEQTGYLLFFPESAVTLQYPDGRLLGPLTREEGIPIWRQARGLGEDVVLVRTHHTTPVAGMPVTGAGLMTLQDGWIVEITDESGHYQPTASNQHEAMETLAEQGFTFQRPVSADESPDGEAGYRDTKVHLTGSGAGSGGRPTGKAEWLDALGAQNPYVPTDDLTLSTQQFEQTQGNEVQARLKAGLNAEFEATQAHDLRRQASGVPEPVVDQTVVDVGYDNESLVRDSDPTAAPVVTDIGDPSDPTAATPTNSLGAGYIFDEQRGLFRQQDTGHYYSESGQLVYQWDPEQGRYYDYSTQTWL